MAPPTRPRIVIGLDVGKSAHWACVVTREGELLASGPLPNREDAIDGLCAQYPGALVVVDQVRNIGSLALSRAKLAGMPRAYLPGLAAHGASKLFAGDAKIDERDAMYNVHLHGAAAQRGPARGMEGLRRLVHRCVRQPGRRRDPIGRPKPPQASYTSPSLNSPPTSWRNGARSRLAYSTPTAIPRYARGTAHSSSPRR